ncbi:Hypothetical protein R9X50_00679800 [Acrodontium crateriforme]|uniref:TAFII28-like protein domain-containing protein n=1 Tax=Acrodontium crateriforme TaxID=150365 RepID=A0AAQ3RCD0_9PEZI|nr:Hypothetical protein R9X50_00679800 [Acrodontium crateriforme]
MASPPGYGLTSPPGPSPLALPRQRPPIALPGQHNRKSSLSSASPAHPLRQTSFPPPDSLDAQHAQQEDRELAFSPSADESMDGISDSEITSAINGHNGDDGSSRKRKRGGGRPGRGRGGKQGPRTGSVSLVNGEDGRSGRRGTAGEPSVNADEGDGEDDDDDEDAAVGGGRLPLYEGGQMTQAEADIERDRKRVFYESVPETHRGRVEAYYRAKLKTADVRRLINQTLSQSVPQNVVLVVASYTKLFAGMLIEQAREVQGEWLAVAPELADGKPNRAFKKLKREEGASKEEKTGSTEGTLTQEDKTQEDKTHQDDTQKDDDSQRDIEKDDDIKSIPQPNTTGGLPSPPTQASNIPQTDDSEPTQEHDPNPIYPGGAGGLMKDIDECDRGPLLPDHLREALRRYKKARSGGTVGFTGESLEGRVIAAPRMGGRRLFK